MPVWRTLTLHIHIIQYTYVYYYTRRYVPQQMTRDYLNASYERETRFEMVLKKRLFIAIALTYVHVLHAYEVIS
jgi:hypothetical protein